ncbi:hypothetical protein DMO17_11455 [Aquipseudomonas alcaligenes]|uniref:Uncharacterized protein n=1 Tax=Aquipseudomonas alcaligenes TaxID=43263 RepID=A0A2V4M3J9_AQUAC|nr:hypothetical protein DMO17_11455 [Pseudomonas alcaligenes]
MDNCRVFTECTPTQIKRAYESSVSPLKAAPLQPDYRVGGCVGSIGTMLDGSMPRAAPAGWLRCVQFSFHTVEIS